MDFIITVDTESDIQKSGKDPVLLRNLSALPRFQSLCERYGIIPTYLITYEVATDEETAKNLKSWQESAKAEVGAHLHPWTTLPIGEGDEKLRFPHALSDQELEVKFKSLHNSIIKFVGRNPTSYRAGRWGFDDRQAGILKDSGYLVDCSVTPKVNWQNMGGPDFRRASIYPYRFSNGLLEVPMTILFTGIIKGERNIFSKIFTRMPESFFKKVLNKLFFRQKWFRIFPNSTKEDWQRLYKTASALKLPAMLFMFHSNDLFAGAGQFTKNSSDVERIFNQFEELFAFIKEAKLSPVTLSGFAKKYNV
ncbi:MAG TPA: hypothetical protein VJI33_02000 [Candidatus Paceibacterota bacterium]